MQSLLWLTARNLHLHVGHQGSEAQLLCHPEMQNHIYYISMYNPEIPNNYSNMSAGAATSYVMRVYNLLFHNVSLSS